MWRRCSSPTWPPSCNHHNLAMYFWVQKDVTERACDGFPLSRTMTTVMLDVVIQSPFILLADYRRGKPTSDTLLRDHEHDRSERYRYWCPGIDVVEQLIE